MGFMRKALFVGTGGASGLAINSNSKKERSARALEQIARAQKQQMGAGAGYVASPNAAQQRAAAAELKRYQGYTDENLRELFPLAYVDNPSPRAAAPRPVAPSTPAPIVQRDPSTMSESERDWYGV